MSLPVGLSVSVSLSASHFLTVFHVVFCCSVYLFCLVASLVYSPPVCAFVFLPISVAPLFPLLFSLFHSLCFFLFLPPCIPLVPPSASFGLPLSVSPRSSLSSVDLRKCRQVGFHFFFFFSRLFYFPPTHNLAAAAVAACRDPRRASPLNHVCVRYGPYLTATAP